MSKQTDLINIPDAITVSGSNVGIGTTSPSSYYANHLVVDTGSSAQSGITIVSDTGNQGMFAFADGTSGDERYRGAIDYNHSNDSMAFLAAGGERIRIDSDGLKFHGDTAAANALNDYEEGTFTPTLITGTVSTSYGFYTKIGNTVIARMEYGNFSDTTSNSNIEVNNLPFTSSNSSSSGATGSVFIRYSNKIPNATYVGNSGTRTVMWVSSSGSYATLKHADLNSSTAFIYTQVIYEAI
jgi:hypothetical protein